MKALVSFRAWKRTFKARLLLRLQIVSYLLRSAFWMLVGSLSPSGTMFVQMNWDISQSYSRRFTNMILKGPTMTVVGIIVALAVWAILSGLGIFNSLQQRLLNNALGIVIQIAPVLLIVIFFSLLGRRH